MPWFFYLLACDGDPEFALIIGGICIAGGIYFDIDRVQRLIQRRREELTEGVFPGLTDALGGRTDAGKAYPGMGGYSV